MHFENSLSHHERSCLAYLSDYIHLLFPVIEIIFKTSQKLLLRRVTTIVGICSFLAETFRSFVSQLY